MDPKDMKVEPSGLIKNPKIVMRPDGPDHKNWLEIGEKKTVPRIGVPTYECYVISYAPNFGHLWESGYIDEENLAKAEHGERFSWYKSGISGHGSP